jgi:hypothetical protein
MPHIFCVESNVEHLKTQKKKDSTQKHINPSLLKEFNRFLIDYLCGLSLETRHLDNL